MTDGAALTGRRIVPLILLIVLAGCDRQSYTFEPCITAAYFENRYNDLVESIFRGNSNFDDRRYPEILHISFDVRTLTATDREQLVASGHITTPTARPEYGDEFEHALPGNSEFTFTRWVGTEYSSFYMGAGTDHPLYKTGILRGWREVDGERYQLVAYNSYRMMMPEKYGRVALLVSHPELMELLDCTDGT